MTPQVERCLADLYYLETQARFGEGHDFFVPICQQIRALKKLLPATPKRLAPTTKVGRAIPIVSAKQLFNGV